MGEIGANMLDLVDPRPMCGHLHSCGNAIPPGKEESVAWMSKQVARRTTTRQHE